MDGRVYDIGDIDDLHDLQRLRSQVISNSHRTVGIAYDLIKGKFRVGLGTVSRLTGSHGRYRTYAMRRSDISHASALGVVQLYNDICDARVGTWALRKDGTRIRLDLTDVPDRVYRIPLPWDRIFEELFDEGWSLAALARLTGERAHTLSRCNWHNSNPKMMLGETVLWAARLVRGKVLNAPPIHAWNYEPPIHTGITNDPGPVLFPVPLNILETR